MLCDLRQLGRQELDGNFTLQASVFTEKDLDQTACGELSDCLVEVNELFRHLSGCLAENVQSRREFTGRFLLRQVRAKMHKISKSRARMRVSHTGLRLNGTGFV